MAVEKGEEPDFDLPDQNGEPVRHDEQVLKILGSV